MCMSCADLKTRPPKALDPTYNAGLYTRNFVIVNTRSYFIDFILFSFSLVGKGKIVVDKILVGSV